MKNRASELCLKNKIGNVRAYALMIGVSDEVARDILLCKAVMSRELIERNCEIFNCSIEYFLCLE